MSVILAAVLFDAPNSNQGHVHVNIRTLPLKTKGVSFTYGPSAYRPVNTLHFGYTKPFY
jgi:hypothetical protein